MWCPLWIEPKLPEALSVSPHPGADGLVQSELPPCRWILTVFTSLACYPGDPVDVSDKRLAWAGVGEYSRPRTTWCPLTLACSPVFPPCATHWRYSTTPTGRYHGRTLVRPSPPACATPIARVFAHTQLREPSRVRLLRTCLGDPIWSSTSWLDRLNFSLLYICCFKFHRYFGIQ